MVGGEGAGGEVFGGRFGDYDGRVLKESYEEKMQIRRFLEKEE